MIIRMDEGGIDPPPLHTILYFTINDVLGEAIMSAQSFFQNKVSQKNNDTLLNN